MAPDPTEDEVAAAMAGVWRDVTSLVDAPGGEALIAEALDAYPGHDE